MEKTKRKRHSLLFFMPLTTVKTDTMSYPVLTGPVLSKALCLIISDLHRKVREIHMMHFISQSNPFYGLSFLKHK